MFVCVFISQSGEFLTVDRCKVQGARYQDDSITDTTIGVCFWNNISCIWHFFSQLKLPRGSLSQNFSFLTPLPSPLECLSSCGSQLFSKRRKRGAVCKCGQSKHRSHPLWISRADKAAPCWIVPDWWGSKGGPAFVFVVVFALSGQSNLVRLTHGSPSECRASSSAHRTTNPI